MNKLIAIACSLSALTASAAIFDCPAGTIRIERGVTYENWGGRGIQYVGHVISARGRQITLSFNDRDGQYQGYQVWLTALSSGAWKYDALLFNPNRRDACRLR